MQCKCGASGFRRRSGLLRNGGRRLRQGILVIMQNECDSAPENEAWLEQEFNSLRQRLAEKGLDPVSAPDITAHLDRLQSSVIGALKYRDPRQAAGTQETGPMLLHLVESLPQMAWLTRADGSLEYCNRHWYEFTGTRPQGNGGDFWARLLHPGHYRQTLDAWRRSMETGEPYSVEYLLRSRDGTYRWCQGKSTPMRNGNGEIVLWFGSCADIHEQKEAQEALRASEERFRLFMEHSPVAVWIVDGDGRFRYASPGYYRLFSVKGDLKGRLVSDVYPPELAGQYLANNRIAMVGDRAMETVESGVRHDGKPGMFFVVRFPIHTESGETLLGGNAIDITQQKRIEEALRKSEELLHGILDNSGAFVFMKDLEGRLIMANREVERVLKLSAENLLGKTDFDLLPLHPGGAVRIRENDRRVAESGMPAQFEEVMPMADGERVFLSAKFPLYDAAGRITGVGGIATDITERKRIEEDLRQSREQFRLMGETIPYGVWRCNAFGEPEYVSQSFLDLIEMTQEEQKKSGWTHRLPPEDIGPMLKKWLRCVETGEDWDGEHRVLGPDGRYHTVLSRGKPVRDENGKIVSWVGINLDITDRKAAEEALRYSEARLRGFYDSGLIGVIYWNLDGRITGANDKFLSMMGYDRNDLLFGRVNWFSMTAPEFLRQDEQAMRELYETGSHKPIEKEYIRKDGGRLPVVFAGTLLSRASGDGVGFVLDITERKRAEEEQSLAAKFYQDSSEAMMVTDEDNDIIAVNEAFTAITGFEPADVIGKNPHILKSGEQDNAFYRNMWDRILETGHYKGELWNKRKNGELFAAQLTINTIAGERGKSRRYLGLMSDITERKRSDDLIWFQANFDALTGLPNRRFFRERLQHDIRNARRSGHPLALMFLDLDGFKYVNDKLGHDMGDLLLKEAAARLRNCVRETDTIARLGGDEFTIVLTEQHEPGNIERVASHILNTLSEPIGLGSEMAHVSASIGITLFPSDAGDVDSLIRNADQAMYAAKEEGKNQYRFFMPEMQEAAIARAQLVSDLRVVLEKRELEIVYQPIVELSSGIIRKAEALIRWNHPVRGMINPADFISAAEDSGVIASFGDWVFREAARQAAAWREKHHAGFQLSVNISPVQLTQAGIDPLAWLNHLRELGMDGRGVVIEIAEELLLDAGRKVTDQLMSLRAAGVQVALDDFGTGNASLSNLKKFGIDYIKLDRSYIRNLDKELDDLALCEGIIALAHKLGILVIAEGVERPRQHELLANAGCDYAQGYLFSKPVGAARLEELLRSDPFASQEMLKL